MKRTAHPFLILSAAAALSLSACSGGPQAQPTKTVTATATASASSASPSASESSSDSSPSQSPSESSSPSESPSASESSSSSASSSPSSSSSSSSASGESVTYSSADSQAVAQSLGSGYIPMPAAAITGTIQKTKTGLKLATVSPEKCTEYAIPSSIYMPDGSSLAMVANKKTMTAISVTEKKSGELTSLEDVVEGAEDCSTVKVSLGADKVTMAVKFTEKATPKGHKAYIMAVTQGGKKTPDQLYFDHNGKRVSIQSMGSASSSSPTALLAEADKVIAALDQLK